MTPQEALLKIKAMFAEAQPIVETPETPAVASFAEYVLASGAKVMIDKLEVGGKVSLVDEMGNEAPAPVGEHYLADGTKIVVDENSTIVEVVAPVAPEAPEMPETEVEMLKKKVAQMEAELAEMKKVSCSVDAVKEQDSKFSKAISELTDVVIELTKTPSVPATQPKESVRHFESKNDKITRFLSQYAKK